MMVVTAPVHPPSFDTDAYPSPASSAVHRTERAIPFPVFTPPSQTPNLDTTSANLRSHAPPRPPKLSPETVVKSSMPPTPDPSPPTGKILFPVQMVALAPPADDARVDTLESERFPVSPPSRSSTPSTMGSHGPHRVSIDTNVPIVATSSESKSQLSPGKGAEMVRSDTQPSLSRQSTGGRGKQRDRDERERERLRPQRRSTMAVPTSVRMVESRSADSRTRLRSTGANLMRYPSLAQEYSSASGSGVTMVRRRTPHQEVPTPPRTFPSASSDVDADLDYGGPDGLEAKVVLLGSQGVGKTSLILRLTTGSFSPVPAPASLDASFYKRKLVHNGVPVKLQIWDTAGQERFRSMAPIYYRGAHVCILVYDISDRKSFQDVRSWLDELHSKGSKDMIIYVVGAKTDLDRQRAVTFGEARRTIRGWLNPPPIEPAQPEEPEMLLSPTRSLFRSSSNKTGREPSSGSMSPTRQQRPHSMHGLASLMAAASDFTDYESPSTVPLPALAPSPTPSVHFPHTITQTMTTSPGMSHSFNGSSTPSNSTSPSSSIVNNTRPSRQNRVSFHTAQSPAQPTFGTTTETAIASTANSRERRISQRFSISGVLGLSRSPTVSDAVSNLAHLAEANPVMARSPPTGSLRMAHSPRNRTESSPLLSGDLWQHTDEWSHPNRVWNRGEGPSAADALEEFGASVRNESERTLSMAGSSSFSAGAAQPRGRARGSSLGRDARLYGDDPRSADSQALSSGTGWGIEVEGVRLGEVSSLTGEGVEAMCRSMSNALVERKDNIERERTLRKKHSVMLTDPAKDKASGKTKGRMACCV